MDWECSCAVAAKVDISRGTSAVCYCQSCREFSHRTEVYGELDQAGGLDLFQVAPEEFKILKGAENLTWMRLTKKVRCAGTRPALIPRWHISCMCEYSPS